ncbi:lysophospholipase L1-like esterase [Flavobacteriaceae bacterium MAR_2009_75]|nr:lysophospholipase L1-like esterase [Flavobacteriaceae bacterium MAR_2009_75]
MLKRVVCFLILLSFYLTVKGQNNTVEPIKVACVGNSITYGARLHNRLKNAYPAQLQNLLGSDYSVQNFGVSGTTLLKKGDYPYWETDEYKKALDFEPDVVFIKLGTNDSKSQNRPYYNFLEEDSKALIQSFKVKNENARVILLLPVPAFTKDSTSIYNPVIKESIIPALRKVAYETESEIIDLYHLFIDREDLLPDKIHPSDLGAAVVAKRLHEHLVRKTVPTEIEVNLSQEMKVVSVNNFHGFQLKEYSLNGNNIKIALPKKAISSKPWVLRARFWGHEPQTDIALLERGFHIAYCDVTDLYGNSEAVSRWNNFYDIITSAGFAKKVVLEAMSRGGLIAYNWAAENPDKVACVYADAPVLSGKSWPGGFGAGEGSAQDWEKYKLAYDFLDDKSSKNDHINPLNKVGQIAKGGFPILHICGEVDKVVPVAENTAPFVKALKESGASIETIYKSEVGHHPHSLINPSPIVDFILRATNTKINSAIVPAPSAEYRSAAGWVEGKDWWAQADDINKICSNSSNVDLLLIGNSITQGFGGSRSLVTHRPGEEATEEYFSEIHWINAGISGDRTQNILWRLGNGNYENANPKNVVLTIGVNNFPFDSADEIIEGIRNTVELAKYKFPSAKIHLFGPLVTGTLQELSQRKKYWKVHDGLKNFKGEPQVTYHEISRFFIDTHGELKKDLFSDDGIHLKPKGYKVWAKYIKQHID